MGFFSHLFGSKLPSKKKGASPYDVVADFGGVLANRALAPLCVADVSELPYSKDEIKRSILMLLATTADSKMQAHLKTGYLSLSSWQVGVGPKHQGWDVSKIDRTKSIVEIAKESIPHTEQMHEWQKITDAEQAVLIAELRHFGFM